MLFIARPRTTVLGNIPNSMIYRRMDQYTTAQTVPGVLLLGVDAPIYFTNASYLRERISRWIDEEEERTKGKGKTGVQYVVLDMGAVGSIDTSGTSMLDELKKALDKRGLQIVLANPGSEIMKKLNSSKVLESIGHEWIFPTVGEAVASCGYVMHSHKPGMVKDSAAVHENMV
uniref:STAS domain-containing protein n=1 Tax=Arundo donax TaxID=35708 RepID=A0A0A9E6C8_ARUDO